MIGWTQNRDHGLRHSAGDEWVPGGRRGWAPPGDGDYIYADPPRIDLTFYCRRLWTDIRCIFVRWSLAAARGEVRDDATTALMHRYTGHSTVWKWQLNSRKFNPLICRPSPSVVCQAIRKENDSESFALQWAQLRHLRFGLRMAEFSHGHSDIFNIKLGCSSVRWNIVCEWIPSLSVYMYG